VVFTNKPCCLVLSSLIITIPGMILNLLLNDISPPRNSFELDSLIYSWNSSRGDLIKKDALNFRLLANLVKISCNLTEVRTPGKMIYFVRLMFRRFILMEYF